MNRWQTRNATGVFLPPHWRGTTARPNVDGGQVMHSENSVIAGGRPKLNKSNITMFKPIITKLLLISLIPKMFLHGEEDKYDLLNKPLQYLKVWNSEHAEGELLDAQRIAVIR